MPSRADALALSRPLLRVLVVLNLLYAIGIGLLFAASLLAPDVLFDALGVAQGEHRGRLVLGMRTMMVVPSPAADSICTVAPTRAARSCMPSSPNPWRGVPVLACSKPTPSSSMMSET